MNVIHNFIVIEGLDGAGTTTQTNLLGENLTRKGLRHVLTFEPTDGPIGKLIRDALEKRITLSPTALAYLYAADRNEHLYGPNAITEKVKDGTIVVSDRYMYSSFAYQGLSVDESVIKGLNPYSHPEFLVYLDTPVEVCMDRIAKRGGKRDLFEKRKTLEAVRERYEKILDDIPEETILITIDGTKSPETIATEIINALSSFCIKNDPLVDGKYIQMCFDVAEDEVGMMALDLGYGTLDKDTLHRLAVIYLETPRDKDTLYSEWLTKLVKDNLKS